MSCGRCLARVENRLERNAAGVFREPEQIRGLTPPARPDNSEIIPLLGCALSANLVNAPLPAGLLCGSFHPLHFGHEQLRAAAERRLGGPVYYEMSIRNVDKPPLDFLSIDRRRAQFTRRAAGLDRRPDVCRKGGRFAGTSFVVGVDTAERIVEPRYYGGSDDGMHEALSRSATPAAGFSSPVEKWASGSKRWRTWLSRRNSPTVYRHSAGRISRRHLLD